MTRRNDKWVLEISSRPIARTCLVLLVLLVCLCSTADANVCVYKTLHVSRVYGVVVDQTGEKITQAKVFIKKAGETVAETNTDQEGNFRLKVPPGDYELHFQAQGFAPGYARVKVGPGIRSALHSNSIRMMLSVGGAICSSAHSSRRENAHVQS